MYNETTQYTQEEIKKMTLDQWRSAGYPVRPFAERFGITREEAKAKLDALIVGNIYESKGAIYQYEGGKKAYLKNRIACNGSTPLLEYDGEFCNIHTLLSLVPSSVTIEEFDSYYKGTSDSMQEWCDKNTCD